MLFRSTLMQKEVTHWPRVMLHMQREVLGRHQENVPMWKEGYMRGRVGIGPQNMPHMQRGLVQQQMVVHLMQKEVKQRRQEITLMQKEIAR